MNQCRLIGAYPQGQDHGVTIADLEPVGRASQQKGAPHARLGSFASDRNASDPRGMSALPRKRTISRLSRYVRFVPKATNLPRQKNTGYFLPPRRQRPCRRAAEQRDERAPFHSITSSARASSVGGTSI